MSAPGSEAQEQWKLLAKDTIAHSRCLSLLKKGDVEGLLVNPVRRDQAEEPAVTYDPLAVGAIWDATGGHSAFVQLLCYFIVEWCNERRSTFVSSQDVDLVIHNVLDGPNRAHVEYVFNGFSAEEKLALHILSDAVYLQKANREYLRSLAARHRPDFPIFDLLHNLSDKEVVEEAGDGYGFRINLIRAWMDRYESDSAKL
jgi:hypothetical protein